MDSFSTLVGIGVAFGAAAFTLIVLFRFLRGSRRRERSVKPAGAGAGAGPAFAGWEEKRRHPRVAVSWEAEIEDDAGRRPARLRDISLGGAFVVVSAPPAPGSRVRLKISLPHAAPLSLNAAVAWSNAAVPEERVVFRGMGVRFQDNAAEDTRRLHEAISGMIDRQGERP